MGDVLIPVLVVAGIFGAVFVYNVLVWRRTWIYMDENAVVMESGRIHTKKKTIALSNIANVNIERNILETLFGTCKVKLDTNSGGIQSETDMTIVLKLDKASEFQAKVMSYVSGENHGRTNVEALEFEHREKACTKKDMLVHCVCCINLWVVGIVLGVCLGVFLAVATGEDTADAETAEEVSGGIMGILTTVILVIGIAFSVLKSFLRYYRFMAYREGDRVHISHGFFTRKMYNIPVKRINAVTLVYPSIGRIFGRCYVEIVCAGIGDEKEELSLLTLAMPRKDAIAKLKELVPEILSEEDILNHMNKQSAPAKRVTAITYCMWGFCFLVPVPFIGMAVGFSTFAFKIVLLGFGIFHLVFLIGTIFQFQTAEWYFGEQQMALSCGCIRKTTSIFSYRKIEHYQLVQGPVLRVYHLVRGTIMVKAGMLGGMFSLCNIDKEYEKLLRDKVMGR